MLDGAKDGRAEQGALHGHGVHSACLEAKLHVGQAHGEAEKDAAGDCARGEGVGDGGQGGFSWLCCCERRGLQAHVDRGRACHDVHFNVDDHISHMNDGRLMIDERGWVDLVCCATVAVAVSQPAITSDKTWSEWDPRGDHENMQVFTNWIKAPLNVSLSPR